MIFSPDEMVDMIFVLGESDKNCLLATRIYKQKFPERRQPNTRHFRKYCGFQRRHTVLIEKNQRRKTVLTEENELNVLISVTEDPHTSSRNVARQIGTSRTSVQRILSKNKMHPYHI